MADRRLFLLFVVMWTLTLAVSMSLVVKFSSRYLMPVIPLWAVILAELLDRGDEAYVTMWLRRMSKTALAMLAGLGVIGGMAYFQLGLLAGAPLVALAFFVACWALWRFELPKVPAMDATRLAMTLVVALPLLMLAVRPVMLPEEAQRIVAKLAEHGDVERETVQFIGKPSLAGMIRVQSLGVARLDQVEKPDCSFRPRQRVVIIASPDENVVDLTGYRRESFIGGIDQLHPRRTWIAFRTWRLPEYLEQHQKEVVIAIREEEAAIGSREEDLKRR